MKATHRYVKARLMLGKNRGIWGNMLVGWHSGRLRLVEKTNPILVVDNRHYPLETMATKNSQTGELSRMLITTIRPWSPGCHPLWQTRFQEMDQDEFSSWLWSLTFRVKSPASGGLWGDVELCLDGPLISELTDFRIRKSIDDRGMTDEEREVMNEFERLMETVTFGATFLIRPEDPDTPHYSPTPLQGFVETPKEALSRLPVVFAAGESQQWTKTTFGADGHFAVQRPDRDLLELTMLVGISDPIESRRRQFGTFRQTLANLCARLIGQ